MDIGKKIKSLRLAKSLTQSQLAEMLGVSKSTMSNYERNISTPSPDIFINLASYFDVTVDYLMNDNLDVSKDTIKEGGAYHSDKALSKDEWNAISYYRRLNDEQRDFIKGQMIQLYQKSSSANKN
ncbi:helix-turn-helix domain-containing protein [Anaerocolumna xylanovorans]|uniref:Transcriptional regulator, contains XRE-family HTH domain n=1 Tax=Anaerocolumna xylanovorans DSM 12503 TaxID=1121345 RepID=A0A1M7YE60_9FIRM|nr:helix-turn-helix transcriptional regulator [Anaerocolumna xylanovorans]SHO50893.1 Transcriptional regulator, contains XRE-family HTH domain [Anaerocolumna xylanovorans DSM 12503]